VREKNGQRMIIQDSFKQLPNELMRVFNCTVDSELEVENTREEIEKIHTKHGIVIEKSIDTGESDVTASFFTPVKICIVTDDEVEKNYLDLVISTINKLKCEIFTFVLRNGESSKSIDNAIKLYQKLIKYRFQRNDVIIALGGGVVGDFSGFVASTYKRGTRFVCIPTTVIAQADSCIGGKTAVNFYQEKNMIGTFYPAQLVYINTDTLKTLSDEQFFNGLSEIIKEGLSLNRDLLDLIKKNTDELKSRNKSILMEIISWCNELKNKLVLQDPYEENGNRQILNFGHTLGHALEAVSEFQIFHGEGVAVGILYAMLIGVEKKKLLQKDVDDIVFLLSEFHLLDKIIPFLYQNGIFDEIIQIMMNDKKNKQQGICFVLLNEIGDAYTENISDRYFLENIWNKLVLLLSIEKK